jgi:protein TonB
MSLQTLLVQQRPPARSDVSDSSVGESSPPDATALRRGSLPLWIIAALGAVIFHLAGIAIAANYLKPEAPDDALGAPAMEVGIEYAAPHVEETDLPPGPPAEDSAASPAIAAQQENQKQSALPKDDPVESDDPDRVVAPDSSNKPKEEKPVVKTVDAAASVEAQASEAAAPPVSEKTPPAEHSTAPVQGTGQSDQHAKVTWEKELALHIDRHKRYPPNGRRRNVEVMVSFTIDRLGHVLSATVVGGTGDPAFNSAAVSMVQRSDPVPAPPPAVADEGLTFTLPVIFHAKGGG